MTVGVPRAGVRRWATALAGTAVVLGGVLIVGGSLLPWSADWDGPLFAFGWEGGDGGLMPQGSGLLIIVEGLVVVVAGLVVIGAGVATGRRPSMWRVTLLASVIAGVVGWADFQSAVGRFGGFSHPPGVWEHANEMGIGVTCILVGAVIGGIASVGRVLAGRPAGPRA